MSGLFRFSAGTRQAKRTKGFRIPVWRYVPFAYCFAFPENDNNRRR
jgi:hypothetical protein